MCWNSNLERPFSGVRNSEESRRDAAADGRGKETQRRQGCRKLAPEWGIDQSLHDLQRARASQRKLRPLLRHRSQAHVEVWPCHLAGEFQVLHDPAGVGRRRRQHEVLRSQPSNRAVIHDEPVFAQHDAIAHAPDRHRRHRSRVDEIQESPRVGPVHFDLAQRGHVTHAHPIANRQHLAITRCQPIRFAGLGIPFRAQPEAALDETGALLTRPSMRRRQSRRFQVASARVPGKGPDRDRLDGRTPGRRPRIGDTLAGHSGKNSQTVDVGGLALIRRHAQCRVALQVLDGGIALTMRQRDIVDGDIVLHVDERLARTTHLPEGCDGHGFFVGRRSGGGRPTLAGGFGSSVTGREARIQRRPERQITVRCAHDIHAGRRLSWHERRDILAPYRAATMMAGEADVGVPSARNGKAVSLHHLRPSAVAHDGERRQPIDAPLGRNDMPAVHGNVQG